MTRNTQGETTVRFPITPRFLKHKTATQSSVEPWPLRWLKVLVASSDLPKERCQVGDVLGDAPEDLGEVLLRPAPAGVQVAAQHPQRHLMRRPGAPVTGLAVKQHQGNHQHMDAAVKEERFAFIRQKHSCYLFLELLWSWLVAQHEVGRGPLLHITGLRLE